MLTLRCLFLISCFLSSQISLATSPGWDRSFWNPALQQRLSLDETIELLTRHSTVVLGEEHYNAAIQAAEAAIVDLIAGAIPSKGELVLGWEFLNTEDRTRIDQSYGFFVRNEISTEEFLQQLFPSGSPALEYAPVLEAARNHQVLLIPTNLSRAQKSPVTRGGIQALDPSLKPSDFSLGGLDYFERFQAAMGSHPLPYPLENYFASQSLTDEVMATELLRSPSPHRVLITGSFHGDYQDGVVHSLERRLPEDQVLYIKILDASLYTKEELLEVFVHPKYGPLADIIHLVNEPKSERRLE